MRRTVLVLGLVYAFCGSIGCFSSPAPSQLPQSPPLVVTNHVPLPVPPALAALAAKLEAAADNTPKGIIAGKAAAAILAYAQAAERIAPAASVSVSTPVSAPVEKPPSGEKPGPIAAAKAWWEHALDFVGWVAVALGTARVAWNVGQGFMKPPWYTGIFAERGDILWGLVFIAAGIVCIVWPWPTTFVVGGLGVAYGAWWYGKHKAKQVAEVKP